MPAGVEWVMRETLYDAMGQRTRVAEWAQVNAQPFEQNWTEYLDYDAFGRPRTIRPPDGPAHDVKMIYTGDRVVRRKVKIATTRSAQGVLSEVESETKERYDRQGRLHQVVEPSGAGGADVTTTYTHDVGNRLSRVRTSSGGVTQTRTFTYDHRGNLESETHPEKDGAVTYSGYDARGHAGRKVDGAHDLTLTYDPAERLTAIHETGGAQRPLKTFAYATTVAANNWKKGKLETATRYNYYGGVEYPEPPSPPGQIFADGFECGDLSAWDGGSGCPPEPIGDVVVAETYTYGGIGGRVSQRDVALALNGSSAGTFTQGWTYTDLGQVASVTYPRCTFTDCTSGGAGTIRTVSHGYARGYPTSVTGYASITYHPNNLVHTVAHTNGVTDTQAIDPNGMARPASIEATRETATGTVIHWVSGTYGYDGAGNITEIGRAYYLYDQVNRLTTGAFPTDRLGTGALVEQTYVYDTFGNIQSIGGTSGRMTPTRSATNRLQGTAIYDAAGNLTHRNGNDYAYDAFNMMTRMTAGAEDWLYVYTADDERIWQIKVTAGTPFHRYTLRDLSAKVLREYSSTDDFWVVERDYAYREGLLLAAETPEGRRHFHLDHLGTPRAITNGSGVREAYHVYYPFGEEATDTSQDQERMKFTGHERDLADASGAGDDLDYMHARHCSPTTARFSSVDPNKESIQAGLPQSWNRYSYARNSPLVRVDPDGEIAIVSVAVTIAVVGAIFGSSAANAPESIHTDMIPSDPAPIPLDLMTAQALLSPAARYFSGFFGNFFRTLFPRSPTTRQMLRAADEVLDQAAFSERIAGPEIVRNFTIHGNKGLVGESFQRNIVHLSAREQGKSSIRGFLRTLEGEARSAGASELRIVGHAVINRRLVNPGLANRLGYSSRQINDSTIELIKRLDP